MKYAHPNFIVVKDYRVIPNDPLFGSQWQHNNFGAAGSTIDADIDSDLAWDFTFGNAGVIIAVIDNSFDMTHPDITPNFSNNMGEIASNGIDDDGNGFIDDRIGWDFDGCGAIPCGDPNPDINVAEGVPFHGTTTMGAAAARGRNTIGVAGVCPECGIIPIEQGASVFTDALAFGYAQSRGARIISNSWGYAIGTPTTMAVVTAINNAVAANSIVLFAMNNPNVNDCGATPDISSITNVIAVSRSDNRDRFNFSGFGNCMDLLAPGVNVVSTDIQGAGAGGANNGIAVQACIGTTFPGDYAPCLTGTSYSTPITAGAVGLILSLDNSLTPRQVQNLLQDCADKIEHSQGQYATNTGFSTPATGNATHGFGRVNAFEATKIAAPISVGGRSGVDIFLRDNALDWGNTEQPSNTLFEPTRGFIPHFESVDIKVDAEPFATAPVTSSQFDAFADERPVGGAINKVYVRVHNRGYRTASSVTVKLHWVYAGLTFPDLPSDFWSTFPSDASDVSIWHPLGTRPITNLGYSGCSVGGAATDASQIVSFDFNAPMHDEATPNHYCLMALVDSPEDRLITSSVSSNFNMDNVTPSSNNATHRNITINSTRSRSKFTEAFNMTNPFKFPIDVRINVVNNSKISYKLDNPEYEKLIRLKPNETRLVKMFVTTHRPNQEGELTVQQVRQVKDEKLKQGYSYKVMGGITFRFLNQK
jgi:subtilisin family serine protease